MSNTSALALHGGTPVRDPEKAWPQWPIYDETERNALLEAFDAGEWWFGKRITRFEQDFAAFQDARFGIACSTGTAALEVMLEVLGIGPGDEVIVPPYTFIATASAVARCGATPIFVDVDDSWNLDPDLAEAAINENTKAVMPVHFGGNIVDMDRYNAMGNLHEVAIIEDACHSWGGKWKGKGTGAIGKGGAFSFQMSKNITAGEGGIILTDDEDFAEACRSTINCGRGQDSNWYGHVRQGTNARITELQAALLNAQLTRLEEQTLLREKNGAYLEKELCAIEGLVPQPGDERMTRRAYHLFCLRIRPEVFGCSREAFCKAAEAEGLPVSTGYGIPLYEQPVFAKSLKYDYRDVHCPLAEDLCATSGMWIMHQVLLGREEDMQDIVAIARKIKAHASELD